MAYQTLWLQSVLGLSAIEAGQVLLPAGLTTFAVSVALGRVLHRTSPRLLIGTGMLIIAAGACGQAAAGAGSGWAVVLPGLFLVGVGAGLVLGPLSAAAMAAVPAARAGMAAGAVNTFRQLGYAIGIAVLGEVFRRGLTDAAGAGLAGTLSSGRAGSVMAQGGDMVVLVHRAYAAALGRTFLVAAGLGLIGGLATFVFVRPGRGAPGQTRQPRLAGDRARAQ